MAKYRVEEDDDSDTEYGGDDYSGQIIDTASDYIRVVCVDKEDAEHIAKLLEANPFPE